MAHVQRPADPEVKEDADIYVGGEEVLRIPLEEHLVAIEKDEDRSATLCQYDILSGFILHTARTTT